MSSHSGDGRLACKLLYPSLLFLKFSVLCVFTVVGSSMKCAQKELSTGKYSVFNIAWHQWCSSRGIAVPRKYFGGSPFPHVISRQGERDTVALPK